MYNKCKFNSLSDAFWFIFSKEGPQCAALVFCFSVLAKFFLGGWALLDFLVISGFWLFRGVIEWLVHSYIHHAKPIPVLKVRIKTSVHYMHLEHHRNPHDLETLLFKGRPVLYGASFVFLQVLFLSADLGLAATFVLAAVIVLFSYECVHFLSHVTVINDGDFLKRVVQNHRLHHEYNPEKYMGVSSRLGGLLFGAIGKRQIF